MKSYSSVPRSLSGRRKSNNNDGRDAGSALPAATLKGWVYPRLLDGAVHVLRHAPQEPSRVLCNRFYWEHILLSYIPPTEASPVGEEGETDESAASTSVATGGEGHKPGQKGAKGPSSPKRTGRRRSTAEYKDDGSPPRGARNNNNSGNDLEYCRPFSACTAVHGALVPYTIEALGNYAFTKEPLPTRLEMYDTLWILLHRQSIMTSHEQRQFVLSHPLRVHPFNTIFSFHEADEEVRADHVLLFLCMLAEQELFGLFRPKWMSRWLLAVVMVGFTQLRKSTQHPPSSVVASLEQSLHRPTASGDVQEEPVVPEAATAQDAEVEEEDDAHTVSLMYELLALHDREGGELCSVLMELLADKIAQKPSSANYPPTEDAWHERLDTLLNELLYVEEEEDREAEKRVKPPAAEEAQRERSPSPKNKLSSSLLSKSKVAVMVSSHAFQVVVHSMGCVMAAIRDVALPFAAVVASRGGAPAFTASLRRDFLSAVVQLVEGTSAEAEACATALPPALEMLARQLADILLLLEVPDVVARLQRCQSNDHVTQVAFNSMQAMWNGVVLWVIGIVARCGGG